MAQSRDFVKGSWRGVSEQVDIDDVVFGDWAVFLMFQVVG